MACRWIRFCVVGGAATLCYILLGLLFVSVLGLPTLVGNGLAYLLSFFVSYLGQSRWTFGDSPRRADERRGRLPAFALVQLFGLALNSLLLTLGMRLGLSYAAAMPIVAVAVAAVVYFLCRFGVFRPGRNGAA